ncbi:MAG TPA: ester cyclase [Ktedonobacterales bacterium]
MPAMSAEEMKAASRRYMDELYNKGNTAIVYELLAPNFVYHTATPPITKDREGIIQEATLLRTAFPDARITVDDLLIEGDKLAMLWTIRGTHKGDFYGVPPTNKQVTWSGIVLGRIVDGKNVEAWNHVDRLGLLQQLGAIPETAITPQPTATQPQAHA